MKIDKMIKEYEKYKEDIPEKKVKKDLSSDIFAEIDIEEKSLFIRNKHGSYTIISLEESKKLYEFLKEYFGEE